MGNKIGKKLLIWDDLETDEINTSEEWDVLITELTVIIQKKNPSGNWHAEVKNFGWQALNGYQDFNTVDGREFLRKILPKTDCKFNVFNYGRGLAIQNFHHDSPTGKEWYYILPRKISKMA
jgi:hypothetical protein